MSARPVTEETRALVRAAVSNAYYQARNDGRTMESAADAAVEALVPILQSVDDNAHQRDAVKGTSGRSPHWVTVHTDAGVHVRLIGGNGEPVLTSEPYVDRRSADRAIQVAAIAEDAAFLEVDERGTAS